jgi:hypothetical protein
MKSPKGSRSVDRRLRYVYLKTRGIGYTTAGARRCSLLKGLHGRITLGLLSNRRIKLSCQVGIGSGHRIGS